MPWPVAFRSGVVGFQTSQVFFVAATLAAVAYILFGPSSTRSSVATRRRRRARGVPKGLRNDGNTCFINAILQGLSACGLFHEWLRSRQMLRRSPSPQGSGEQKSPYDLEKALATVLGNIRGEVESEGDGLEEDVTSAHPVTNALRLYGWKLSKVEQDANEFFHCLLITLEEQGCMQTYCANIALDKKSDLCNLNLDEDEDEEATEDVEFTENDLPLASEDQEPQTEEHDPASSACSTLDRKKKHKRRSSGVFSRTSDELSLAAVQRQTESARVRGGLTPFSGTTNSRVTYAMNGQANSPTMSNGFIDITLHLPSQEVFGTRSVTLERLLALYVSPDPVEDSYSGRRAIMKQTTFGKLPPCLCLHIQRISYSRGMPEKVRTKVIFDKRMDMGPYMYSSPKSKKTNTGALTKKEIWYCLRAVIEHRGNTQSGHYVTYRRGWEGTQSKNKWFITSDANVEEVEFSTVESANGFMFFYEKEAKPP